MEKKMEKWRGKYFETFIRVIEFTVSEGIIQNLRGDKNMVTNHILLIY